MDTDVFGIAKLHPDAPGGRVWVSSWHRTPARTITHRQFDPHDCECEIRGVAPVVAIDGAGLARVSGADPRVYVYDRAKPMWGNVEVTVYARRVAEPTPDAVHQGFIVGARSEHQDYEKSHPEPHAERGTAYYGRVMYASGHADFKKELGHPCYTSARGRQVPGWEAGVPRDAWVGLKFVVRDTATGDVHLELFRDLTDGAGGGTWERLTHTTDAGGWWTNPRDGCTPSETILTGTATSVFLRNTTAVTDYRRFSVREITAAT